MRYITHFGVPTWWKWAKIGPNDPKSILQKYSDVYTSKIISGASGIDCWGLEIPKTITEAKTSTFPQNQRELGYMGMGQLGVGVVKMGQQWSKIDFLECVLKSFPVAEHEFFGPQPPIKSILTTVCPRSLPQNALYHPLWGCAHGEDMPKVGPKWPKIK